MEMLNILIIDDENNIREILADIINLNCKDAKVIGFAEDVKGGISAIKKYKPDIILLDIKLPDGSGFDILSEIQTDEYNFHVIFITAYEQYAIKAFKFSAIDYLVKPVDPDELLNAIERCRILYKDEFKNKIEAYSYNSDKLTKNKKLLLKTQYNVQILEIQNIIRCQSDNSYTTFFTSDNRKIIVSQTIGEYEKLLNEFGFFRIHQSHLINLEFVMSFDKGDGGFVIMKDKTSIPISFRKKELFLKVIKTYHNIFK